MGHISIMWRIVLLISIISAHADNVSAEANDATLQRIVRSPNYDCPPYYYPPPPPPPPPHGPPPFWPPPPYWRHHHHDNDYERGFQAAQAQAQAQAQQGNQVQAESQAQAASQAQSEQSGPPERLQDGQYQAQQPCLSCGDQSSAISNAKSDTGSAIAIAIARAKTNK